MAKMNQEKECKHIRTYDFFNVYISIPNRLLKYQLGKTIKKAYETSKKTFITIYRKYARWTESPKKQNIKYRL